MHEVTGCNVLHYTRRKEEPGSDVQRYCTAPEGRFHLAVVNKSTVLHQKENWVPGYSEQN